MYRPKYFSLEELLYSDTALSRKYANNPSWEVVKRLSELCELVLDPVREEWEEPIIVTSGYRVPILNKAVGGSETSDHMTGEAVDIRPQNPTAERMLRLFNMIHAMHKEGRINIDQCILYRNKRCIHIGIGLPCRGKFLYK